MQLDASKDTGEDGWYLQVRKTRKQGHDQTQHEFSQSPEWATGTSPEAVFAMTKLCLEAGARESLYVTTPLETLNIARKPV